MTEQMDESYEIAEAWAKALASNAALETFCMARFGRAPSVQLGFDAIEKHGEPHTPYVLVVPMSDKGGFEVEQAHSVVLLVLGLEDESAVRDISGATIVRGFQSLRLFDAEVQAVLVQTEFPPSAWEAENSRPGEALFEKHTFYQVIQDRTI